MSAPKGAECIQWATRVPRHKIRLLYERDAQGIRDEELIDEVAYAFYARCQSILTVTEAALGRVACPICSKVIHRQGGGKAEIIRCHGCSWEITWGAFQKTYQHKQLTGGGAVSAFKDYVRRLPGAQTLSAKMLLIDELIHACHVWGRAQPGETLHTRPAAVNVIGGNMTSVMALLDELAYGPSSSPGALERKRTWQRQVLSAVEVLQARSRRGRRKRK